MVQTTKTIGATYTRISNDPTGREAGVERQDKDCLAIARREAVVVPPEHRFRDNDVSASKYAKRARRDWQKLMALVEAGQIRVVIVYDLDRLLRQPKELERLIDAAEGGLRVFSATGVIDLSTAGGILVARMMVAVAAHEADRVSARSKTKLRHDADNGRPHWSRRPYGYASSVTVNGERQVQPEGYKSGDIVSVEAAVICAMAHQVLDGASSTAVAKWANDAGYRTAAGKRWQSASVKFTLMSARTAGLREHKGEVMGEGTWSPILDRETWENVRARLELLAQPALPRGKRSMLTGLVHCAKPGCDSQHAMHRASTNGFPQYRCTIRPDGGCGQSVSAARVEEAVIGEATVALQRMAVRARTEGGVLVDPTGLQAQLDELDDMLASGELDMRAWRRTRVPLQKRYEVAQRSAVNLDLESRAHGILVGLVDRPGGLKANWDSLEVETKRALIALVVEDIRIGPADRRWGRTFDGSRINIAWRDLER